MLLVGEKISQIPSIFSERNFIPIKYYLVQNKKHLDYIELPALCSTHTQIVYIITLFKGTAV